MKDKTTQLWNIDLSVWIKEDIYSKFLKKVTKINTTPNDKNSYIE